MRGFFTITFAVLSIGVILLGGRYVYSRESIYDANLLERYQQVNRVSFDAKLPYVSVSWADLSALNADGITSFDDDDHPVSIALDRQRITSERDLSAVLRHEACHVSVGEKAAHGLKWQQCMDRFRD